MATKRISPTVDEASAEFDELSFTSFHEQDLQKLRATCSLLAGTHHNDYFIGVTFKNDGILDLEVSVVHQQPGFGAGTTRHRVPLNSVATQYAVLQDYAIVGIAAARFMQGEINWGEFKTALHELVAGDLIR